MKISGRFWMNEKEERSKGRLGNWIVYKFQKTNVRRDFWRRESRGQYECDGGCETGWRGNEGQGFAQERQGCTAVGKGGARKACQSARAYISTGAQGPTGGLQGSSPTARPHWLAAFALCLMSELFTTPLGRSRCFCPVSPTCASL